MSRAAVSPERIQQLAWGYAPPLIIEAALHHGVFDLLDGGSKTVEEVAAQSGASVRGLRAIMNALAGLELLTKDAERRFGLTADSAAFLVGSKPGFLGGVIRHTSTQLVPKWLELGKVARTGPPVSLIFAVNMLVNTDEGDTWSFGEIAAWLREAGFRDPRTIEAPGPSPLILATKP
jgi:hypothetical protein